MFATLIMVMVLQIHMLKLIKVYVQFTVYQLYQNKAGK